MAGLVSRDVIDQVRNTLDIADVIGSYVELKRAGHSAKALCPFHKEKTPSFHVNSARQAFHCFGCGAGGDVFKFVMLYENVDFPTALRMLADRAGVALQYDESAPRGKEGPAKDDLFKANEEAARRYQQELQQSPAAAAARAYLDRRALPPNSWKEWGIGYAPDQWGFLADSSGPRGGPKLHALAAAGLLVDNDKGHFYDRFRDRIMFTIRDEFGRAVGFSGRLLKPSDEKAGAKYVNTPETPAFRKSRLLYGLHQAKQPIREQRRVILCEGQIDCIRCHLGGFTNAVASQGTAITSEHASLLRRRADEVIIVLDADIAGQKAALRTAELLLAEGLAVQLAVLPPGQDPDSLILHQGPAAFAAVLTAALSPINFLIGTLRAQPDWQTQAGLARATRAALEIASQAQGAVQAEQMLREAAAGLNVGFRSLQSDLRRIQRQKYRLPSAQASPPPPPPAKRPADETELALLLGTHANPELTGLVRQWLRYDLITDPTCRAVIHALAEEETDLMAALNAESDACKTFAAQVVNAPQKIISQEPETDVLKAAQDLIARIWQRHLETRRQELGRALAHTSDDQRTVVLQEFAELLLDQKNIAASWSQAQPIIELHLHRFDD